MKKKGFVLAETIIVITVLCVILVVLYGAYSQTLIEVNKKAIYDNTEYIYKANIIRNYLEDTYPKSEYEGKTDKLVCSNNTADKCYNETGNTERQELFKFLQAEAVYVTIWNTKTIGNLELSSFEATSQSYIKSLSYTDDDNAYRLVIMFKDENELDNTDDLMNTNYQYATIRFGSRG